jgi:alkaline phosphatase D
MRRVSRRHFLAVAPVAALPVVSAARLRAGAQSATDAVFRHGVASGDPLTDRVVLWTRVTTGTEVATVRWVVATDPQLRRVVARGETPTGAWRDHTVKIDVTGLQPGTAYYYQFESSGGRSPLGRTRTLPGESATRLRVGVVSCSNLPQGYFNAYGALARRPDLDAVLHLGDYIYEYANAGFGDGTSLGRIPSPNREIVVLADYRMRHAQYKADPDSIAMHRQHPLIAVWDDHEFTNNTWRDGAQNHNPDEGEGEWRVRRAAALQAYFEWMPVREVASLTPQIYRTLRVGRLADLIMLDTRLVGRDQERASRDDVAGVEAADRQLLGAAQEAWLHGELAASAQAGTRWQILGQQVMFAPQTPPGQPTTNTDSWDGYRPARDRVFDMIAQQRLSSVAVLTGDVHASWVYDLPRRPFDGYDPTTGRGSMGVEFVGTSVSSPSSTGSGPDGEQRLATLRAARPHLHYVDGRRRGYYVLDVTRERIQADYFTMATVQDRRLDETFVGGFAAPAGQMHLTRQSSPVAPPSAPDPAA